MKRKVSRGSENKFKKAVEATPDVANCYQSGLSALEGKYRDRIKTKETRNINGSIDIDRGTIGIYPTASRWDYAIGYNSEVYFIEIHPANMSDVTSMIKKLKWLKSWLNDHAPQINKLKTENGKAFTWIHSGKFAIPKQSRQYLSANQEGILPVNILELE